MPRALARLALAAALLAPAAASAAPWDMSLGAGLFAPVPHGMSLRPSAASPALAALLTPGAGAPSQPSLSAGPALVARFAPVSSAMSLRSPVFAAPGPRVSAEPGPAADSGAARLLADAEDAIKAAEQVAAAAATPSAAELAERLVAGQVQLEAGDAEGAAIVFLDLLENAAGTPAAVQARYYLGEALLQLRMRRWASECFSLTLADVSPEARRLHQRSVAHLLGLAAPARTRGHARKQGLSVMPELRARMQSVGLDGDRGPGSELSALDITRLRGWVAAVPAEQRIPELRYAWGRFLFLSKEYDAALAELDGLAPADLPLGTSAPAWRSLLRATYVAGAAAAALGRFDEAIVRFDRIVATRSLPGAAEQEIRELAWMARARLYHDRGDYDGALLSYRSIGRASPLYASALYEIAWTLLRADRHEAALAALDQLLRETPDSPAAAEAKSLRGKLQIRRRNWKAAEDEFAALRRHFDDQYKAVAPALAVGSDALDYVGAVIRSDPRHFALDVLVPRAAIPLARNLPRAVQAERLARETGETEHLLRETLALLGRMEIAAASPERALLFTDLGAHWQALDRAARDLGEAGEALLTAVGRRPGSAVTDMRRTVDALFERPSKQLRRVADLGDPLTLARAEAGAVRARLVGLEYTHRESSRRGSPDPFFQEAAALRSELGALEDSLADAHRGLQIARATLRFTDPLPGTRRDAIATHNALVGQSWPGGGGEEIRGQWQRRQRLLVRLDAARKRLGAAAQTRLARAVIVLREERDNLARYRDELEALRPRADVTAAEAVHAGIRDVAADLRYWTTRADVGLLDVAWATKEAELELARDLERTRDRSFKSIDRAVTEALEDSE